MLNKEDLNSYGYNLRTVENIVSFDSIPDITDIEKAILNARLKDVEHIDIEEFYYKHYNLYDNIDKLTDIEKDGK